MEVTGGRTRLIVNQSLVPRAEFAVPLLSLRQCRFCERAMSDEKPAYTNSDLQEQRHKHAVRQVVTMVRWLLYLVFAVISFIVLRYLAPVFTPILAAAGIAYLLDPSVDKLEARGVKRVWAVTLLLLLFLGTVTTIIILMAPLIAGDVARFILDLPSMVENAANWLAKNLGFEVPEHWQDYLASDDVKSVLKQIAGPASALAAAAVGGFFSLLSFLVELLLIPVFAFYFLLDWDHIVARIRSMIPPRHRAAVVDIVIDIDSVVSNWIRGQFIVTSILAVLYATCFYPLGVPLAIPIGLLVGLLTIIPFLGTFVGAGITILFILLDWQSFGQLAGVTAVFVGLHLLEAAVLTPKIVGKKVGLGESGALFAVLAGGQLLGLAGVLLAVPLAASIAVLIRRLIRYYEGSEFFGADDHDHSIKRSEHEVIAELSRAQKAAHAIIPGAPDGARKNASLADPDAEATDPDAVASDQQGEPSGERKSTTDQQPASTSSTETDPDVKENVKEDAQEDNQ